MAQTELATRIPKELHRKLRLHCVTQDISVMDFVAPAIREKLAREGGRQRARGEYERSERGQSGQ